MAAVLQRQAMSVVFALISLVIPALAWLTRSWVSKRSPRKNLPTRCCALATVSPQLAQTGGDLVYGTHPVG